MRVTATGSGVRKKLVFKVYAAALYVDALAPLGTVPVNTIASTDITRRRRTELELQELRADLAHVARVSLMGELAASIAHELNQPLMAILTNARAALRFMEHDPPNLTELREILEDIAEADHRAAEVIRRMRGLVKKEETLDFAVLDLPEVMGEVVDMVRSEGPGAGLFGAKITGGGSGGTVAVLGDQSSHEAIARVAAGYAKQTGHQPYIFSGSSSGTLAFDHLRLRSE